MWYHLKNGFKLVRGFDLLLIALGLYCFQYFMIVPILDSVRLYPTLNGFYYSLLVVAVLCIAAAGYVIHDFFDHETARLSNSQKNVVGIWISLDKAFILQGILNAVGIALAYFLAWKVGNYKLGNLFVVSVAILWTYAMFLKNYFLLGNLVKALLWATIFILPVLYEQKIFSPYTAPSGFYSLLLQMKGYALFIFLAVLILDIISDMAKREMALLADAKTLAVVLPAFAVKTLLAVLTLAMAALIGWLQYIYFTNGAMKHFWYVSLLFQPHLVIMLLLNRAAEKPHDWHNQSVFAKLTLLFIILSLPFFALFNAHNG